MKCGMGHGGYSFEILVGTLACFFSSNTHATMVRLEVSGVVDYVDDANNLFPGVVSVGQPFTLWYEFDTAAPDLSPDVAWIGEYQGLRSGFILPQFTQNADLPWIQVVTVNGGWLVFGGSSPDWSFRSDLYLMNFPLTDDHFPWPLPPFKAVSCGAHFRHASSKGEDFGGSVTLVTATELPEPNSLVCALPVVALCCRWRRVEKTKGMSPIK